jgi:hypothetical protein
LLHEITNIDRAMAVKNPANPFFLIVFIMLGFYGRVDHSDLE